MILILEYVDKVGESFNNKISYLKTWIKSG